MQASIVLSTTSFVNGATIPYKFKNNSVCGQVNISPQFSWQYYGLIPAYVEYFNFYVEDTNVNGTSPNGKFLHWGVEKISSLQNYISENGGWLGNDLVILPTDYLLGDNINGWNGPCVSSGIHTYNCWIEVKIYSEYYAYVFGSEYPIDGNGLIYSNILTFTDHLENLDPGLKTGSCNTYVCPLNYTLNDNLCYQYIVANAIRSTNTYQIRLVEGSPAFGAQGTRFYANADQTVGPLRGSIDSGAMGSTDAVLQDNDGTGVILSYTLDNSSALWKAVDAFTGRLNILRVWTLPVVTNEWIGHSICLMVATTKKYCIGVGANTKMRIKINGNLFARFDRGDYPSHSGFWHVLEITLHQGINIIEIEGYSSTAILPALGFEIYEATITQLMALQTVMDLTDSGYSTVKSSSFINSYFNIGSNSGYSCPQGFAYDVCTGNQCIDINYVNAQYISCCWRIINCDLESEEEYIISFSPNETGNLYIDDVYALSGHPLLDNKCFILTERVICEMPQFQNIVIIQDYGTECSICRPSWIFQSCGETPNTIYISFSDPSVPGTLIIDDIYKLDIDTICYKYIGITTEQMPDITDVNIVQHYDSTDCEVCRGCAVFIGCDRNIIIQVSFAPGQIVPTDADIDTLYRLQGPNWFSTECWKFKNYSSSCFLPMQDVVIIEHIDCTYCSSCKTYYKLINCANPNDTQYIFWSSSNPLYPSIVYTFNIGEPNCYTAELQFTPCDEDLVVEPIYNESNILAQYPEGCDECNAICYKIIDCGETIPIGATEQDMSGYVGYIIQWVDEQEQVHCSTVEPYTCRLETYTMLDITVDGCYATCEKCFPPVSMEPEFSITHRSVSPGYTTPECSTGSSSNSNCSSDPCTPCNNS